LPHRKHPCAHPGCTTFVTRPEYQWCVAHYPRNLERGKKIAAALKGRTISDEARRKLSAACRARFNSGSTNRLCEYCKKPFTVDKPCRKQRFCCKACGYANRKGEGAFNFAADMPRIICRVCGKEFRTAARSMASKRFTCSHTCKNVWQRTHQKTRRTDIERITERALIARGWHYEPQVGLCGIVTADFYLPTYRAVIFCDGDYWHNLPDHQERDRRQDATLKASGYTVYRFWGREIKADINACLDWVAYRQGNQHFRQLPLISA